MKKRKVIPQENLRSKLPITLTIAVGLLLDRFSAPGWSWGIYGTFFVILWVVAIIDIVNSIDLKPFD